MSKFYVKVCRKEEGAKKIQQFFREAEKVDDLVKDLQSEGYLVLSIQDNSTRKKWYLTRRDDQKKQQAKAHGKTFWSLDVGFFEKVTGPELLSFFVQLIALLRAGVPILRSLTIIEQGLKKGYLKKILNSVKAKVSQGFSLSNAMADFPKVFPYFWLGLIEAGEASGSLPDVLEEIYKYQETTHKFKSKLTSAMVYPTILICFCIGAITIFMVKIIPTFEQVFKSFGSGRELPEITQFVLNSSRFLQAHVLLILIGLFAMVAAFVYLNRKRNTKRILDSIKLQIPIFGTFMMDVAIVRFSRGLGTMVRSGTPIIRGLEISSRLIGNVVTEDKIDKAKEDVKKGTSIASALEKYNAFPFFVTQLVAVGEESGSLEKFLDVIANFFEERVNAFIQRLSVIIEPMIILFMGLVVGTLVISMFLPLIEISTGGH